MRPLPPYQTQEELLGKRQKHVEMLPLRDRFAMAALPSCITIAHGYDNSSFNPSEVAKAAYQLADAMLEARKTK